MTPSTVERNPVEIFLQGIQELLQSGGKVSDEEQTALTEHKQQHDEATSQSTTIS